MEPITIRKVSGKKELDTFIYLPSKIHKEEPGWLPPIYMDEYELFNAKKNKSFLYCDTIMLLAYRGKRAVGRIMGIISHRYNQLKKEENARFCFLDAYNDAEVVQALLREIETWAIQNGMDAVVGPLGFSDKDPQGLQFEGFDYPSVMTAANNSAYLPDLVANAGYNKKTDLVEYLVVTPEILPPVFTRVLRRFQENSEIKLITFRNKKELRPYILDVLQLMNDTFEEIYGFVPLSDPEKRELARRYMPILDVDFIKVVTCNGQMAGFSIAMPDISEGIQKSKGRLFPFGIFRILRAARKTDRLIMLLGGIKKEHRGKGIDALMGASVFKSALARKFKYIDSHLVLEENRRMRSEYERIGGEVIKRYRIFSKAV